MLQLKTYTSADDLTPELQTALRELHQAYLEHQRVQLAAVLTNRHPPIEFTVKDLFHSNSVVLAINDGVVVGYAVLRGRGADIHNRNIYVKPEFRRQGIGSAMLVNFLNSPCAPHPGKFTADVTMAEETVSDFYRTLGFSVQGQNASYFAVGAI